MLNIICGKSGCGKTEMVYEKIKNDVKNGKKAFLIVPEQQTVISEKQIVSLCSNGCNMYLEVLNFTRLSNRVFREYGGISQKYIDGGGKALLLGTVLEELGGTLEQYPNSMNADFIARLSTQLENFQRRGCIDALNAALNAENGFDDILAGKLRDVSLIYTAYKNRLHENFSDPTDDLERLCATLDEFAFFEDANVYFDGFFEFCVGEFNVMRRIAAQADEVYVTLATSDDVRDESLRICREALNKLKEIADNRNEVVLKEDLRTKTRGLKYLKEHLFDDFAEPCEAADGVEITVCRNIYEECKAAARRIVELVRSGNVRYSDISVAVRSPDDYRGIIDLYFEKYGIPFFMSARQDITLKPLLSFVFAALECVCESFKTASVQRYLKSGLSCLEADEVFLLENYILMWNISGKAAWEREWNMNPDGYGAAFNDANRQKLEEINRLRIKAAQPLTEMSRAMNRADVRKRCKALYEFLSREEILSKINEKCRVLRENGNYSAADEELTVWNILMNCLDQMVLIMGDAVISAAKFAELLKIVCSNYSSAKIPSSLDQVQIGEAGHMRTDNVRHTFVLGLCENEFPRADDGGGLFSEKEIASLAEAGIDAGESGEFSSCREKMFFYLEVARPSEGLHLFRRTGDMSGAELTESSFAYRVEALVPNMKQYKFDAETCEPICLEEAFEYLIAHYNEAGGKLAELRKFFEKEANYADRLAYLEMTAQNGAIKPHLSPKFFADKDIYMSQSSFERYINCRYSYFVTNLLGAKAQKKAKFDYSIVGTFVHAVLERFMKSVGGDAKNASDDEIRRITDEIVREYISENLPDFDNAAPRFKYLIKRISKTAFLTVQSLVGELRQSDFEPLMLEEKIGGGAISPYEIELNDGSKLIFKGVVDRVDVYKSASGEEYVRIMDYKTGKSSGTFKLKEVLNGFKLQMLIYLFSVRRCGIEAEGKIHRVIPAGILYVPAVRPKVKDETERGEQYDAQIATAFKRSGLLLDNDEIIYAMEKNPGAAYLPVKVKDGKISAGDSLATLEQFGSLEKYIRRLTADNVNCLKKGNIDVNPYNLGKDSCEYCDNYPICRYEGTPRKYDTVDDTAEAWAKIERGE